MKRDSRPLISIVVIGLNEENLIEESLSAVLNSKLQTCNIEILYVDSGSTDRSFEIAQSIPQVKALKLNSSSPSAAKARNFGAKIAKGDFIQFVDGDSILHEMWLQTAYDYLFNKTKFVCVFGELIERHPEANLYTKLCMYDWYIPPGEYRLCGGNAFWRKSFLDDVGFFDETLFAGEEPDLCYRVRQNGGRIFCLDAPMVKHDLEMNTFHQYWKRGVTSGKAYAAIGLRYRHSKEKLWFKEMLRNFIEPMMWLIIFGLVTYIFSVEFGLIVLCLIFLLRAFIIAIKNQRRIPKLIDGILYGLHLQFVRIPTFLGELKFLINS